MAIIIEFKLAGHSKPIRSIFKDISLEKGISMLNITSLKLIMTIELSAFNDWVCIMNIKVYLLLYIMSRDSKIIYNFIYLCFIVDYIIIWKNLNHHRLVFMT